MRMILTGIATLAVAGAALVAAAQPGGGRGRGRHGDGPNPAVLKQELGLSDEQSAQLQKLRQEERKQAIRRRADMEIARMELEQALDAATVDEKVVAAKVQALTQLQAAALKARVDHRLAIGKLLTPEQREKMKQLKQEHRGRDRGRERGRHGRFGSGPAGQPVTPTGPAVLEQGER
jgi:Spy/CpxP family protein refolding chaperone